jgi:putative FmdB family regulatory protein
MQPRIRSVFLTEVIMPRYEFYCEDCQKPFERILSLAEYEKDKVTCPKCGRKHVQQEAAAFFAVTSKKS